MKDITEDNSVKGFIDQKAMAIWKEEDDMLACIEQDLLNILFILKGKYPATPEYSNIRSNLTAATDKVNTLRRKVVAGEESSTLKEEVNILVK